MSPRSIRRAAERQQQKLARKAARQTQISEELDFSSPECLAAPSHVSEARFAANRANAQLSTGPTSPDGKAKSSLNALKTGLTGRTVLLPTDDAAAYQQYVESFFAGWQPATDAENALVQSLADTGWRLLRIPSLEYGIYAIGRLEFANLFQEQDASLRSALIEAHTYLAYQRQLNNLSIQESRLRRQRDKDTATLQQLQSERHARETARRTEAAKLHLAAPAAAQHARPSDVDQPAHLSETKPQANGFEFSTPPIDLAVPPPLPHEVTRNLNSTSA